MTQGNLYFGGSILICGKSLNVQKNLEFLSWKSVTADGSLLSPTGGVKGMYPAPLIHEHLATAYWHEQPGPHCEQWHGHHKAHGRVQCAVLSTPRTVCWCTVSHIALVAQGLAVCVIPCHPCMRTCVLFLEWSLLTRLSTSLSCSSSSSTWCPTRRLTSSPSKIPCATPAWGAWSLWTMSHPLTCWLPRWAFLHRILPAHTWHLVTSVCGENFEFSDYPSKDPTNWLFPCNVYRDSSATKSGHATLVLVL